MKQVLLLTAIVAATTMITHAQVKNFCTEEAPCKEECSYTYADGEAADGYTYDGEWSDNCPFGYGTLTWNDGTLYYKGSFEGGMMRGGFMYFAKGAISAEFNGYYVDNKPATWGRLTATQGDTKMIAAGKIANNQFIGNVKITYTTAEGGVVKYVGSYKDGLPNGEFERTDGDGSIAKEAVDEVALFRIADYMN